MELKVLKKNEKLNNHTNQYKITSMKKSTVRNKNIP